MIRIFPVAAPASFSNDFNEGRSGGRLHAGNDIFGERGAPLVAVDDGQLRSGRDPLGGNIVNLYATDGTRYYYAHLDAFTDGTATLLEPPAPRMVRAGEIVGFLGNTGNAANTPSHVHFEVHPGNGSAVNPFPQLQSAPRMNDPRATPSSFRPSPRNVLMTAGALALLGLGAWALLYPDDTQALVRRLGGAKA